MKTERNKTTQGGMDLLAFLTPSPDKEQQGAKTAKTKEASEISSDWEAKVKRFLDGKGGKAMKTELYDWAKQTKIPPAILYHTISRMISEGKLVKRFDEGSKELIYELNKESI